MGGYFREEACVEWKTVGILFLVSLDPQAFDVLYVLMEVSDFDCVKLHWIESVALRHCQNISSLSKSFASHVLKFSFSE